MFSWMIAVLYACTDEYHQLFVPGRSGQLRDVMIDAVGAADYQAESKSAAAQSRKVKLQRVMQ
ncbi:MAG: VanZ family protein [Lachnospiraceae bacterium]|nr:MAG: VanZ family protein [Lachnospiraceae bacterium]